MKDTLENPMRTTVAIAATFSSIAARPGVIRLKSKSWRSVPEWNGSATNRLERRVAPREHDDRALVPDDP
ncbi:hypothetical protein [Cohnella soli]|uniref:Uncharacterized protein n=1 Tax=Cohnella soli TaxID=425005 RepID=A0ABW0HZA9_9BACL